MIVSANKPISCFQKSVVDTCIGSSWNQFSGPSVVSLSAKATFSGIGYAPNSGVTIMVATPSGAAAGYSGVTDSSGALHYGMVPTQLGAYKLTVTDSGGRTLSTVNFIATK